VSNAVRVVRRGATLALLSATAVSCGHVDKIAPCPPPPGVTAVSLPDGLAKPVRIASASLTDPNIPLDFDAADVVETGTWHFVFAWQAGIRWIVATDNSGTYSLFVFDVKDNARMPTLIQAGSSTPEALCREATTALSAHPPPGMFPRKK
jgi:hypothetical protein